MARGDSADDELRRKYLGIFYTPSHAARFLASWAVRSHRDTVLEPSFGGCALLEAIAARLGALGNSNPICSLQGFDVDPAAFRHLRTWARGLPCLGNFQRKDFLAARPGPLVASVIGNPPFTAYHQMTQQQRLAVKEWRDQYNPAFPLSASLWVYFVAHAQTFLATGGRLAFVLPQSVNTSVYSEPLKDELVLSFDSVTLCNVNEQLFSEAGAVERPVFLLASGYRGSAPRQRTITRVASSMKALEGLTNIASHPSPVAEGWQSPARATLVALVAAGTLARLNDSVSVRIGEVIGDTAFFVKRPKDWSEAGISATWLEPLATQMRQLPGLRVTQSDVAGLPTLLRTPKGVRSRHVQNYLAQYSATKRRRNVTFGKRQHWYAIPKGSVPKGFFGSLSYNCPRIVLNDQAIRCANNLYKIDPLDGHRWHRGIALATLTSLSQLSIELEGHVRGEGALKLDPRNVRNILVPKSYLKLSARDLSDLSIKADNLLRAGNPDAASQLVDKALLLDAKVLSEQQLTLVRDLLRSARNERLHPSYAPAS